jgi:hypothetical protein
VRTDAHQPQCLVVRFFVDQKQIGFEVALAMIGIFARQGMVVKSLRQGLIRHQQGNSREKIDVESDAVLSLGLALVVPLEFGGLP